MNIRSTLISGAGNTFHIVWQSEITDHAEQKKISEDVCKKHLADGFIFLNASAEKPNCYTWDFYNNDGSDAEMCGNATRCVGYFIKNILKNNSEPYYLKTVAGQIQIQSQPHNLFEIQMTEIIELKHSQYFYCDTGVPHIIIEFADFKNYKNYLDYCKNLRFHEDFLPRGTNVTLILKTEDQSIVYAVSYERGVEDFTLACGTGAMAAAFYNLKKYNQIRTQVAMPGGNLIMNLQNLKKPVMIGPAILLGEYNYEHKI